MATRIVIAGASTLLGAELKSLLEESRFAAADFRLVDEELVAGTITEAAGEAAVIQTVEDDSFDRADIVFFTGSSVFTQANLPLAQRSGAIVIDLSGALKADSGTMAWFTNLELLQPSKIPAERKVFIIPSAAGIAACSLYLGLAKFNPEYLSFVALQPVSESG